MKLGRRAPTIAAVEAEAAAFHVAAAGLMTEMVALREDISETAADLAAFAKQLKEAAGAREP